MYDKYNWPQNLVTNSRSCIAVAFLYHYCGDRHCRGFAVLYIYQLQC